jgi:SAM-dependent methyltransferase
MYDYFLGGRNNYPADREAAEQFIRVMPAVRVAAKANRRFLIESVRWLAQEAGVRQFLDIGSGLPTQQNVHEVAQAIDPNAKVVYVDNDPLVCVHAEALLATSPNTIVLQADIRDPETLLAQHKLREHLDFTKPIALLLVAMAHFIQDTRRAYEVVTTLRDALPPGSYLVMSHGLRDESMADTLDEAAAVYKRSSSEVTLRTREEIARFFNECTLLGSGLSPIADWSIGDARSAPREDDVIPADDDCSLDGFPLMCGVARIDRRT